MRRLARHFLLVGAMAAILLLIAVSWLWLRNRWQVDYVEYGGNGKRFMKVISGHGTLDFLIIPRWPQEEKLRVGRYDTEVYYGTRYSKRLLGFGTDVQWPEYGGRYVNVPHWFFVLMFGGMGFWLGRKWWKSRPKGSGRCRACGYDMRATPETCPECGETANVAWAPRP